MAPGMNKNIGGMIGTRVRNALANLDVKYDHKIRWDIDKVASDNMKREPRKNHME